MVPKSIWVDTSRSGTQICAHVNSSCELKDREGLVCRQCWKEEFLLTGQVSLGHFFIVDVSIATSSTKQPIKVYLTNTQPHGIYFVTIFQVLNQGLMTLVICVMIEPPKGWCVWGSGADLINPRSPVSQEASASGVPPRKASMRTCLSYFFILHYFKIFPLNYFLCTLIFLFY